MDWKESGSPALVTAPTRAHLAAVFTGGSVQLFVNGLPQTDPVKLDAPLKDSELPFLLGKNPFVDEFGFRGRIDELRVSNVARYTVPFEPPEEFGSDQETLVLYHFSEGSGNVLKDSSGNNHHGTIFGAHWVGSGSAAKP